MTKPPRPSKPRPDRQLWRCFLPLLAFVLAGCVDNAWQPLFNGRDLTGWDGNPELWTVENGVIVGQTRTPDDLAYNQFLIWRGGRVGDFELHATIRQSGNNSGIQYRSREFPEVGRWVVGGYQLDVHPIDRNNGQLYDERGRLLVGRNGHSVAIDPAGEKWLVEEMPLLETDDAEWHEYSIVARGNQIEHRINGTTVFRLTDYDEQARALNGLLAFQIHRGPPMKVEIKDVRYRPLPPEPPLAWAAGIIPAGTGKVPMPTPPPTRTSP